MDKPMTLQEAWADFYAWARKQDFWKGLSGKEKRKLYDAQADYLNRRGQKLGRDRIEKYLSTFAPGRYEFRDVVILHEK